MCNLAKTRKTMKQRQLSQQKSQKTVLRMFRPNAPFFWRCNFCICVLTKFWPNFDQKSWKSYPRTHKFDHFLCAKLLYFRLFSDVTAGLWNSMKIITLQLVLNASLGISVLNLWLRFTLSHFCCTAFKISAKEGTFRCKSKLGRYIHNWFSHSGCVPYKITKFAVENHNKM